MEGQLRRLGPNSKITLLGGPNGCGTTNWLVGRGSNCQIYTKSKYASRQHFSITYREQKYYISDLQSCNGTFVNDEKLTCEKLLNFGNVISVGVPSEMQNSPECIVYVFESNSNPSVSTLPKTDNTCTSVEIKCTSNGQVPPKLQSTNSSDQKNQSNKEIPIISLDVEMSCDDNEKTTLNESQSSDVILLDQPNMQGQLSPSSVNEPKPAKIRKLDDCFVGNKNVENEQQPEVATEEDLLAYEAPTQMDEPQVKSEPDLINYSQTEELIEISDSEDDWPTDKLESNKSPELLDDDDDDEVVILETTEKRKNELPPVDCQLQDDMTEIDKKWFGKLLKIKEELPKKEEAEKMDNGEPIEETTATNVMAHEQIIEEQEETSEAEQFSITPCTERLEKLSTSDKLLENIEPAEKTFPKVELPKKVIKKVKPKKSVSFDLEPQIKYYEPPTRTRFTASEKGKMRLARVIFNICNWNTHWLEECKKVAPDKIPEDICEEKPRKIPNKFSNHSDYMVAFLPLMLLNLWNKIKDSWVASGESGFRQTVSCDSCEDYPTENLSVYHCTGLVQSVSAHKNLLREGHLVLLRLHQSQVPEFVTPQSVKYSKKLGYLVFGFVEGRSYERYNNQPLHRDLAERCASIVGDLHIVRLTILVKRRPSFLIDKQKLIQLTVVHQISQEIRMFKGICLLPDSPLCNYILKPNKIEDPLTECENGDLVFKGPLDEIQSEIVRKLSYACSSKNSLLYSIHGASGTGKGQVVVALILQLLYGAEWKGKRPKIIYCTQWSAPLDEMVSKLKSLRSSTEEPFNLVRIGSVKEVKRDLRDLCISNLASNIHNSDTRSSNLRNFDAEFEVIKEADILCSTCTAAGTAKMCASFEKLWIKGKERKIICIIDEAMSCKEIDGVIPLLLGVTHLILVGDIFQMEPMHSGEKTHALGLDTSLFSRIYKNFVNTPKNLRPITVLKRQYRMNNGLFNFTSQLIYKTLPQKSSKSVSNSVANIKSHLLIIDQTPQSLATEEKENREIRMVSQLTKAILKLTRAAARSVGRFGVITCDTKLVNGLQAALPKREFPEVEIDQIPAFQGQELDVAVVVFNGRKILESWLATALTRARRSLFIFASETSIAGNPALRNIVNNAKENNFLKYIQHEMNLNEFESLIV